MDHCPKLIPVSPLAKLLAEDLGVQNFPLTSRSFKIGRNVPKAEGGLRLKTDWIQFSQTHARVHLQEEAGGAPVWLIQDTSTNGTWVNGNRVDKGTSVPLNAGDVIRMSTPPGEVLEFRFAAADAAPPPAPVEAKGDNYSAAQDANNHKRKASEMQQNAAADQPAPKSRPGSSSPCGTASAVAAATGAALTPASATAGRLPAAPQISGGRSPVPAMPALGDQVAHSAAPAAAAAAASHAAAVPRAAAADPVQPRGLAQHEKQIQDLQRKLAATRRQLDEASAKVRALTEQDKRRSEAEEERVQEHVRQANENAKTAIDAVRVNLATEQQRASKAEERASKAEEREVSERAARARAEEALAAAQAGLEEQRERADKAERMQAALQEEVQALKGQLAAVRAERDQAELRRSHEAELRARAQEEVASLTRDVAAQQESKEASQRAAEAAQRAAEQARDDALLQLATQRTARVAAEDEVSALQEQLYADKRKLEALEEQLQANDSEASGKRMRAEALMTACSNAKAECARLLQQLEEQAAELAAAPRLDAPPVAAAVPAVGTVQEAVMSGGAGGVGAAQTPTQATSSQHHRLQEQTQQQQQPSGGRGEEQQPLAPHVQQPHRQLGAAVESCPTSPAPATATMLHQQQHAVGFVFGDTQVTDLGSMPPLGAGAAGGAFGSTVDLAPPSFPLQQSEGGGGVQQQVQQRQGSGQHRGVSVKQEIMGARQEEGMEVDEEEGREQGEGGGLESGHDRGDEDEDLESSGGGDEDRDMAEGGDDGGAAAGEKEDGHGSDAQKGHSDVEDDGEGKGAAAGVEDYAYAETLAVDRAQLTPPIAAAEVAPSFIPIGSGSGGAGVAVAVATGCCEPDEEQEEEVAVEDGPPRRRNGGCPGSEATEVEESAGEGGRMAAVRMLPTQPRGCLPPQVHADREEQDLNNESAVPEFPDGSVPAYPDGSMAFPEHQKNSLIGF